MTLTIEQHIKRIAELREEIAALEEELEREEKLYYLQKELELSPSQKVFFERQIEALTTGALVYSDLFHYDPKADK